MSDPLLCVALPGHVVDLSRHALLTDAGVRVDLRPQALDLLCLLAGSAGETVDKRRLMGAVWSGVVVTDDSLVQAIGDIRRAIGDHRHEVLQTVPRRGYRLIGSAVLPAATAMPAPAAAPATDATSPVPAVDPAATPDVAPPGDGTPMSRRRPLVEWALGGLLLIGAVASWQPWAGRTPVPHSVSPDRPPIAVLDFGDAASPADDRQMARAYAEELTGELARNADLTVISPHSSLGRGGRGAGLAQIAKQLGVGYLVTGSLRREGERLRLLVQLVEGHDGRVVWTERHDVAAPQVYAVREALVQRIAGTLHTTMRTDQDARSPPRPPASMDLYARTLRAITLKHRFTREATVEARALLQSVVAEDPMYAPGWLYLGFVQGMDYTMALTGARRPAMLREAIEQLERAQALDPRLSQVHAGLVGAYLESRRHDDALRAGRRCVELAPSDADCMAFLANVLQKIGQPGEALQLMRRVMAISPLPAPHLLLFLGDAQWANRQIDDAVGTYGACIAAFRSFAPCWISRAYALAEQHDLDQARRDTAEWLRLTGVRPNPDLRGAFAPAARDQVERRFAALARIEAASAPAPAAAAVARR